LAKSILASLRGESTKVNWLSSLRFISTTPEGRSFLFARAGVETHGGRRELIFRAIYYLAWAINEGLALSLMSKQEERILTNHASTDPCRSAASEALRALNEFHAAAGVISLGGQLGNAPIAMTKPNRGSREDPRLQGSSRRREIRISLVIPLPIARFSITRR
jgi:hypothetical protein